ncbi:C-X-C motif chemokine 10-like [Hemicordylus capensis]|uniref:C-X-C motif chemokine 10-like n=1 Tax=Hemicordylus capensis TaxID=884348 RepID=UPI002304B6A1|nr:C-X-C motif chemokine 10-like [Hemicordylus capensis]
MIKKSFLILLLLLLGTVFIQGMPTSMGRGRCLCRGNRIMSSVNPRRISGVEYHRPSSNCDQEELVVTFKGSGQKGCLNISSDQGRRIKAAIMKKKK